MQPQQLIAEFIEALTEEIEAVRSGRGGSVVHLFDGRFVSLTTGLYVYSFTLENFITTVDDAPADIEIDRIRYRGQVIQTRGLEVIVGLERDFGLHIPEARLIINLVFLNERLKEKLEAVRDGQATGDFTLANSVFTGSLLKHPESTPLLALEPYAHTPNDSQKEAITASQRLPLTLIWGPPGTGKTETLARAVECFLKREMRVLVVAHANAAVDEATDDIADLLKTTDFYNRGQIIRLGNCREDLKDKHELVILDRVVDVLGAPLKQERERLEAQLNEVGQNLDHAKPIRDAIGDAEALGRRVVELERMLATIQMRIAEVSSRKTGQEQTVAELQLRLEKAQSAGAIKRLFLGLNPAKIRQDVDRLVIEVGSTSRLLAQVTLQRDEMQTTHRDTQALLHEAMQRVERGLQTLGVSKAEVASRVKQ